MNRPLVGLFVLMLFGSSCRTAPRNPDSSALTDKPERSTTTSFDVMTTTTTIPPTTSTSTTAAPAAQPALRRGDHGPEVRRIQERLIALGYWLGSADGAFGQLTEQAVFAFQKVHGIDRDGVVGHHMRVALDDPESFRPASASGIVWEIDKARQVLVQARDGVPVWIWNTSTGTEKPYRHEGRQHVADTPEGRYSFTWQVDGVRDGELGPLYRPKYFHPDGLAIHGYGRIPPQPASHGCARVSFAAMDFIWASNEAPLGAALWVY